MSWLEDTDMMSCSKDGHQMLPSDPFPAYPGLSAASSTPSSPQIFTIDSRRNKILGLALAHDEKEIFWLTVEVRIVNHKSSRSLTLAVAALDHVRLSLFTLCHHFVASVIAPPPKQSHRPFHGHHTTTWRKQFKCLHTEFPHLPFVQKASCLWRIELFFISQCLHRRKDCRERELVLWSAPLPTNLRSVASLRDNISEVAKWSLSYTERLALKSESLPEFIFREKLYGFYAFNYTAFWFRAASEWKSDTKQTRLRMRPRTYP